MLWQRVLTALIGIPIVLILFYFSGLPLFLATSIIIGIGLMEFFRIAEGMGSKPLAIWGYIIGLSWIPLNIYLWEGKYLFPILLLFFFVSIVDFIWRFPNRNLKDLCLSYFGGFYLGGLFSYMIKIREIESKGWILVLLVFLLTWVNDSAAYFIGSSFGKHRLCPKLSPKKSIEGFFGGMFFTLAAALIFGYIFFNEFSILWGVLGVLAAFAGALGDLFASALKRLGKVKDSGKLIPGHGGLLDRLDSLLLIAPLTYYYLQIFIL